MRLMDMLTIVLWPFAGVFVIILLAKFGQRKREPARTSGDLTWISIKVNAFYVYFYPFVPAIAIEVIVFLVLKELFVRSLTYYLIASISLILPMVGAFVLNRYKYANVAIQKDGLLVSRFSKVLIPFGDIENVRHADTLSENTYQLVIEFNDKSLFGKGICFFAVNEHIEGELLSLIGK